MAKRKTINEFENVRNKVLRNLSVEERLHLAVRAKANGHTNLIDRLHDTCQTKRYEQPIVEFTNPLRMLFVMGQRAIRQLERSLLLFKNACLWAQIDGTAENSYRLPLFWAKFLLARHRQWKRFAEEVIGVSLETWLALQEGGEFVVASVRDIVDEGEALLDHDILPLVEIGAELMEEEIEITDDERSVADFGDALYEAAADTYYNSV